MATKEPKIGKRLYNLRRERDWTQRQMAELIGIHRVTLALIEKGTEPKEGTRAHYKIKKFLEGTA
jgi:DNA-binding XRE family transcriptional regulator